MRKLGRIELHCGIMVIVITFKAWKKKLLDALDFHLQVDAEMKREWNQRGRVINTDMLVYGG